MKKKKTKTKAQKRLDRQRKELLSVEPDFTPGKSMHDFTDLVWCMVDLMLGIDNPGSGDVKDVQMLAHMCMMGWNAAVSFDIEDEAADFLESLIPDDVKGMEREMFLDISQSAAYMKFERFPEDSVLFKDVHVLISGGNLEINPIPDYEELDAVKDVYSKTDYVNLDKILDFDALEKLVEDLPSKQVEKALKREIAAQLDRYNKTPQEELGGLSPDEVYAKKLKTSE